jgi:G:T-mismatch repair DNA endonuclease (very short patch repair protein)
MSQESIDIIFDNFKLYTAEEIQQMIPNENLSDIIARIQKFKKRLHHTPTLPEIQVKNILLQNHIKFGSEVYIRKCNCRVDFLLLNNVVLEVYGDFWHGNKTRIKESSLIKQREQILSDINRFTKLCDNGYKVFTLWEYDIMYRPWIVTAHILQIVKYFNLK